MGVPMISPKLIVECPGLSAKKRLKKRILQKWKGVPHTGEVSLFKIGGWCPSTNYV